MIAALLLASGRSSRFGAADKLTMPLGDHPVGHHAAQTLASLPFDWRLVVTIGSTMFWPGFEPIINDQPDAGMSHSVGLGVSACRERGAEAVLIALADMPLVSREQFAGLLGRYSGPESLIASSDEGHRMVPALFGSGWFPALEQLRGDRGARELLDKATTVLAASPDELVDIDTPDDLEAARSLIARPKSPFRFGDEAG